MVFSFCEFELITAQKPKYPPAKHHAFSTSKNVLFSGHNHLLTTGADDLTF